MSVVLKVLMSILMMRLSSQLEAKGLLRKEQAGFRSHEEVISQVIALYEICLRRRQIGCKTWVAFIDFRKAYDTVPHAALFAKLSHVGVRGKALRFLKAIYEDSHIAIRSPEGVIIEQLMKGVRQGCPLSPILFDVFINDILDDINNGAMIPGIYHGENRIPGLLLADDLVGLSGSRRRLFSTLQKVEQWSSNWEMDLGVQKCGIVIVGGSDHDRRKAIYKIKGEPVPVLRSYTYLGIPFNDELDLSKAVMSRLENARRFAYGIRHFLTSRSIPISSRVLVAKCCIVSRILFGSELWGMNQQFAAKGQKLMNEVMRWISGTHSKSTAVPIGAAEIEMEIPPIEALAAAQRARIYAKSPQLRTWLKDLVEQPYRGVWKPADTWVTGTRRWLRRFMLMDEDTPLSSKEIVSRTWDRLLTSKRLSNSINTRRYLSNCFRDNICYKRIPELLPDLKTGFQLLLKARIGSLWTGRKLALANMLPADVYTNKCPCCNSYCFDQQGETLRHILMECSCWVEVRTQWLNSLILDSKEMLTTSGIALYGSEMRDAITVMLLGGKYNGVGLQHWTYSDIVPFAVLDHVVAQFVLGCSKVASFLQAIHPKRMKILKGLIDKHLEQLAANAPWGGVNHDAQSPTDQGPTG